MVHVQSEGLVQVEKKRLRSEFRERRLELGLREYARRCDQIVAQIKRLPEIIAAGTVHAFWPMPERREIDIRPLIAWLHTHEKQIVLPVVVNDGKSADQSRLEHRYFSGEDALVRSRWGIQEPTKAARADIATIDAVVVPAVAVGRDGSRIGYGRGHYDRFLARTDVPTICPVFDFCLLPAVPVEAHDRAVSVIVTESEVLRRPPS